MIITVEISHYPLTDDYEPNIIHFINRLKDSDCLVRTTALSTLMKGELHQVFDAIKLAVAEYPEQSASTVIKIVNRDLPIEDGYLKF